MLSHTPMPQPNAVLQCGRFQLPLNRPLIMGIVNVTPDSFSDGGHFFDPKKAIQHAEQLIDEGADILDIGGESSRPGAHPISEEEELSRVLPVIQALQHCGIPLSLDTVKAKVMSAGLQMGVDLINDVNAFQAPGTLACVVDSHAALCVMHKQGVPASMQLGVQYEDVVKEVGAFLAERLATLEYAGVQANRIILDPGFGFGKKLAHNLALLTGLPALKTLGAPLLVGLSRKSMLGEITGRAVSARLAASLAAALIALNNGARIIRVHDVAATRDMVKIWEAVQ